MLRDEQKLTNDTLEWVDRLSKGLARLTHGDVDAVLLDLGLPDSQGLDTFEKVNSAAQKIPILVLTFAYPDENLAYEAVRRGAQDYLLKGKTDGALLTRAINYAIERKKADEAIKRQAELIDLSPDAIIIKKPDDTITFWSLGAEKVYGWTKGQAIGQEAHVLFKTKSSQQLESIYSQLKKDGKWSGELAHNNKNGCTLTVQSYWLAKFNGHGEIAEIFESNIDVTGRKDAERLAAIGSTAGMVGHDIRNPLQAIISDLYLAKTDLASIVESAEKKNIEESLDEIEKNIGYINKIVTDLQDFAKSYPNISETNLKCIVNETLNNSDIPENIKVSSYIEEGAEVILADSTLIKRILTNLFSNALQAMPKGGKVNIHGYREGENIILTVEDTGMGIPENVKAKLFTPLFTTKSKGQGFGLAVVKRMTEALNGTVSFTSEEGGTTFTVRLPHPQELNSKWTYK